jgi:hypothetical protein
VTQILPSFALGDPELTKKLTMRNVLCACTGIPRRGALGQGARAFLADRIRGDGLVHALPALIEAQVLAP